MKASLLAAVGLLVWVGSVQAQQVSQLAQFPTWSAALALQRGATVTAPRMSAPSSATHTHWLTGGIIGAVTVGGVTAVGTANGICQESGSGCVVFTGVMGSAVGFVVGALIGGQF